MLEMDAVKGRAKRKEKEEELFNKMRARDRDVIFQFNFIY